MKLFIELGNTRLKAALIDEHYEFLGAVENQQIETGEFIESLDIEDCEFDFVYVASVSSHLLTSALIEQIQNKLGVYPSILTTQPRACGIECGYEKFETLGVDRWLGIIAASSGTSKPMMVVSAGTAITIDVVIDKVHRGGFIVPGIEMMRSSLTENTALIAELPDQTDKSVDLLATNTENAVLGGTLYMATSYLNALIADLEAETGRLFDCIGTGGDFSVLQPMLDKDFKYVKDLSIQGMIEVVENC